MPSELPDSFGCGPFVAARNPDVGLFVDKLNKLREAVDACRIQPGVGYTFNRSAGGTSLNIKTGDGSSAPQEVHPFKIYVRSKDKKLQAKIQNESLLLSPEQTKITGLNAWNNIGEKDICYLYLEAQINNHIIQSAKIDFSGESTSLVDPANGLSAQTATRIPIGSITKDGLITQSVKTHVRTELGCLNGFAYLLIVPL